MLAGCRCDIALVCGLRNSTSGLTYMDDLAGALSRSGAFTFIVGSLSCIASAEEFAKFCDYFTQNPGAVIRFGEQKNWKDGIGKVFQ
jgi:hypothetical protein